MNPQYIQYEPRKLIKSSKFIKLGCSYEYSIGLTSEGTVYGWGKNYIQDKQSNEPELIAFPTKIKDISVGAKHSAAIDVNGAVFTWGSSGRRLEGGGQLGHNSYHAEKEPK